MTMIILIQMTPCLRLRDVILWMRSHPKALVNLSCFLICPWAGLNHRLQKSWSLSSSLSSCLILSRTCCWSHGVCRTITHMHTMQRHGKRYQRLWTFLHLYRYIDISEFGCFMKYLIKVVTLWMVDQFTSYCYFAGRWGDNGIMNGIKLKKLLSFVSRPRRREDVSWGECVGSSVRLQVIEGQFPRCSSSCVHHCYKSYQYIFWNKSQSFCTGNLISYSDPPTRRAQ